MLAAFAIAFGVSGFVDDEAPRGDAPPPPEATEDAARDDGGEEGGADVGGADVGGEGAPAPSEAPTPADGAAEPLVPALDEAPADSTPASTAAESPRSWLWRLWSGGVHVGALVAPVPTLGATLGAGVGGPWWSLRVEGSIDGASFDDFIAATVPSVAVAPCVHVPFPHDGHDGAWGLVGCATGTAGGVFVDGEYAGVGPYVGAGGRLGLEARDQSDGGALRATVQLETPIVGYRFHADDGSVFTSPPVNVVVAVAFDAPGG